MRDGALSRPSSFERIMLTEQQKAHGRVISIFQGAAASVWSQFTGGFGGNSYLSGFFLWLGASPFSMGLYAATAQLANIFQPVVLWTSSRVASRKRLVIILTGVSRPPFFALALLALVRAGVRVELALAVFLFFELATAAVSSPWQSWISDLVDPPIRASYFATRNLATGLVSVPSALLAGYLLDLLGRQFLAFLTVFAIGSIFGGISILLLISQDEELLHRDSTFRLIRIRRLLIGAREYRLYLLTMALVSFSAALMGPYAVVMMIRSYHYSYATLGLLTVAGSLSTALFQPLWARLGERRGQLRMLKVALVVRVFLPLGWALSIPSLVFMVSLQVGIGIIVGAGMGLLSFNVLLAVAPPQDKLLAFSLYASILAVAGFAGNLVSGLVLLPFLPISGHYLLWALNPYRFVFLVCFLFRLVTAGQFLRLRLSRLR